MVEINSMEAERGNKWMNDLGATAVIQMDEDGDASVTEVAKGRSEIIQEAF